MHKLKIYNKKIYRHLLFLLLFLGVVIFFIYLFSPFREGMTNTWSADTIKNFPPAWAKYMYAAQKSATPSVTELQSQGTQLMNGMILPLTSDAEAQQYISSGNWGYTTDQIKALTLAINQRNAAANPPQTSEQINTQINQIQVSYPFGLIQFFWGNMPTMYSLNAYTRGYGGCLANSTGDYSFMKLDASGNPTIPVSNDQLPGLLPGFKFINSPCNICELGNNPPNYSCPFSLSDSSGNTIPITPVMEYSWKVGQFAPAPVSVPTQIPTQMPNSSITAPNSGSSITDKLKNALSALTG
jgi:hypothetical protein